MSEATRAIALTEAVKTVGAEGDAAKILAVAAQFHTFLQSDAKPNASTSLAPVHAEPPKNATTKTAAPAAAKPAAAKPAPAKKAPPAKTEEQLAAEALAAAEAEQNAADAAGDAGANKEAVGAVVAALLAAGQRNEAINLLKKFGASSVSGVKAEDYDAFVAEGNELLVDPTA